MFSNTGQFRCIKCPEGSEHGMYPNCDCSKIGAYNKFLNECTKCPKNSIGIYPNCTCIDENAVFKVAFKRCETCVVGSPGKYQTVWQWSKNFIGKFISILTDFFTSTDYNTFAVHCKRCPIGVDGVFPDCKCSDGEFFDGQNCLRCPWNSKGPYGNCTCDENLTYDKELNECLGCPFKRYFILGEIHYSQMP